MEPAVERQSWVPMTVVALAQMLMSFNFFSLPVSVGGIVESFDAVPTSVGTAIVTYSLFVAAFTMLGAKVASRWGPVRVFRAAAAAFGVAMLLMTFSRSTTMMITAQAIAGIAAAAIVPTLVVLIATNYSGKQQAKALGLLGAAQALAGVLAFLVAGALATWVGWRYTFGMLIAVAVLVVVMSGRLRPIEPQPNVQIDGLGVVLAAASIILVSFGFDLIHSWGLLLAKPGAPFSFLGLSPAALMIVAGTVIGQYFFVWIHKRHAEGKTPLAAVEVIDTPQERSALYSIFVVFAVGAAVSFLIPLYIQIVQGRSSLLTSFAIMPYTLSVLVTAVLVVRLYDHVAPRKIAQACFAFQAIGLAFLALVIRNEWSTFAVIAGLIVFGLAEGALVTLLFNVLVTASPKELAGDVGSMRGTAINMSSGVGTAIAGALAVGLLGVSVARNLPGDSVILREVGAQLDLDSVNFVGNDRLLEALQNTSATPAQIETAVAVNTEARLWALKMSFLILAGVMLLAVIPAHGLPDYIPGEVPAGPRPEGVRATRTPVRSPPRPEATVPGAKPLPG
jgi:predicted MFS family arabinose efflux permease